MQEQIERESIAVTMKASKLTAQTLTKALKSVCGLIAKKYKEAQTPHGEQSVKKLMNHNVPTSTIPIEGDKGLFEKVARKWEVDYAFHKTEPGKYLLLFKSGQASPPADGVDVLRRLRRQNVCSPHKQWEAHTTVYLRSIWESACRRVVPYSTPYQRRSRFNSDCRYATRYC